MGNPTEKASRVTSVGVEQTKTDRESDRQTDTVRQRETETERQRLMELQ